jgi:general secretion pathway protein N
MSRSALDWQRQRRAAARWAVLGSLVGALLALLAFAPSAWLAGAVANATHQRLLLADARGSIWSGSALAVLTGGPGSRDASTLPGRLSWDIGIDGMALSLRARHACCINGDLRLRLEPGFGRMKITLPASQGALGQWPASWLAGLGTPFNTLNLGGWLSLSSSGLVVESAQGRLSLSGAAALSMNDISSTVSTLDTLGSYRLSLTGGQAAQLVLSTLNGPLRLVGNGQWAATGLRFRGEATAEPGSEGALNNLLNIIGRRQGTLAVLSIG